MRTWKSCKRRLLKRENLHVVKRGRATHQLSTETRRSRVRGREGTFTQERCDGGSPFQ